MADEDILIEGRPLSELRVVDLKKELDKRGLSKSGSKLQLIERLKENVLEEKTEEKSGTGDYPGSQDESNNEENELLKQYFEQKRELLETQRDARKKIEEEEERQRKLEEGDKGEEQVEKKAAPSGNKDRGGGDHINKETDHPEESKALSEEGMRPRRRGRRSDVTEDTSVENNNSAEKGVSGDKEKAEEMTVADTKPEEKRSRRRWSRGKGDNQKEDSENVPTTDLPPNKETDAADKLDKKTNRKVEQMPVDKVQTEEKAKDRMEKVNDGKKTVENRREKNKTISAKEDQHPKAADVKKSNDKDPGRKRTSERRPARRGNKRGSSEEESKSSSTSSSSRSRSRSSSSGSSRSPKRSKVKGNSNRSKPSRGRKDNGSYDKPKVKDVEEPVKDKSHSPMDIDAHNRDKTLPRSNSREPQEKAKENVVDETKKTPDRIEDKKTAGKEKPPLSPKRPEPAAVVKTVSSSLKKRSQRSGSSSSSSSSSRSRSRSSSRSPSPPRESSKKVNKKREDVEMADKEKADGKDLDRNEERQERNEKKEAGKKVKAAPESLTRVKADPKTPTNSKPDSPTKVKAKPDLPPKVKDKTDSPTIKPEKESPSKVKDTAEPTEVQESESDVKDKDVSMEVDDRSTADSSNNQSDGVTGENTIQAKPPRRISRQNDTERESTEDKQGETTSDKPARKRRWGSKTAKSTKKTTTINISTDSLKGLIPDIKPSALISDPILDLGTLDSTSLSENEDDLRDVKIKRTVVQQVDGESEDEDAASGEEEKPSRNVEEKHPEPVKETVKEPVVSRKTSRTRPPVSLETEEPEKARDSPSPPRNPVSTIIHVSNLVRPFTVLQLQELLKRTGSILEGGFWIDKIKSHCYASFESKDQAFETRKALHGTRWPSSNPKILRVDFATEDEFQHYKINEEGPPVAKPESKRDPPARKRRESEKSPRDSKKREEQRKQHVREWDRDKIKQRSRSRSPRNSRSKSRERRRQERLKERKEKKEKKVEEEAPAKLLDDLFKKTKATPCIYWLPLTEEQIEKREQARKERQVEREKRKLELDAREAAEKKLMQHKSAEASKSTGRSVGGRSRSPQRNRDQRSQRERERSTEKPRRTSDSNRPGRDRRSPPNKARSRSRSRGPRRR